MLGSILPLACNAGILIAFIVGHFFDYQNVSQILIGIPILYAFLIALFPETPSYLLSTNRSEVYGIYHHDITLSFAFLCYSGC